LFFKGNINHDSFCEWDMPSIFVEISGKCSINTWDIYIPSINIDPGSHRGWFRLVKPWKLGYKIRVKKLIYQREWWI
jgi:hypothetical protein